MSGKNENFNIHKFTFFHFRNFSVTKQRIKKIQAVYKNLPTVNTLNLKNGNISVPLERVQRQTTRRLCLVTEKYEVKKMKNVKRSTIPRENFILKGIRLLN